MPIVCCLVAGGGAMAAEDARKDTEPHALNGTAARALRAPAPIAPNDGQVVEGVPAFSWRPVKGATKYDFQVSADAGFRSTVASFETVNTSASLDQTLFDGNYYWRARAVRATGTAGRWSAVRSVRKRWSTQPQLLAPGPDASITYPTVPLVLRWSAVPHAFKYEVAISADPTLAGNLLTEAGKPVEVVGTAAAVPHSLSPGRYYWAVTPMDAGGLKGRRSEVGSFVWSWPSTTTAHVSDLNDDPRVFDPQFHWDAVPGAAKYEVEVNPSQDFAPGSRVCCTDPTTGTSLSPTKAFPNNTYYWRVRAFDLDGNAGVWNVGPNFQKDFDGVVPTIPNLRLRNNTSDLATGAATSAPMIAWDPVPGASSYDVQVVPYVIGGCNWSTPAFSPERWDSETASTAWAPLGTLPAGSTSPILGGPVLQQDASKGLVGGHSYCVRVRARGGTDSQNQRVVSDWSQVGGLGDPAFTYTAPGTPVSSGPLVMPADNYGAPAQGSLTSRMPIFTWTPVTGACQYFVVVSADAAFTKIVDQGLTRQPTYASRLRTYPDETTTYYWAVMPVNGSPCDDVFTFPQQNNPHAFEKRSEPPTRVSPADGGDVSDQPTFRWTSAEGAREYRLQVATNPNFSNPLDDVKTAATAYTSSSTYPADTEVFWRVRANDENGTGLTWSSTGTFPRRLRIPVPNSDNPTRGQTFPVFSWSPVQGAVSYDLHIEEEDGDKRDFPGRRAAAVSFVKLEGLGVFRWQVRANFPKAPFGTVPGGYTPMQTFTRFIDPPSGARLSSNSKRVLLTWDPSPAAKMYKVEFSETNTFNQVIDTHRTANPNYAPRMNHPGFQNGGLIYWRVAALDEGSNAGGYAIGSLKLPRSMRVTAIGLLQRRKRGKVTVTVTTPKGRPIRRARVKVKGAGLRSRRARRTGKQGTVKMSLRPRRRGSVSFTVRKRGYRAGKAIIAVR